MTEEAGELSTSLVISGFPKCAIDMMNFGDHGWSSFLILIVMNSFSGL